LTNWSATRARRSPWFILRRTQGATPKEYATELFNRWGVGKREADNGVLLLVSLGDRRVEIETGYGMEAILPDAVAGEILDTAVVPRFRAGDIPGGGDRRRGGDSGADS
jgi:uncharacterized protein